MNLDRSGYYVDNINREKVIPIFNNYIYQRKRAS